MAPEVRRQPGNEACAFTLLGIVGPPPPEQQRAHLISGYVSIMGQAFGLDGVVAANGRQRAST